MKTIMFPKTVSLSEEPRVAPRSESRKELHDRSAESILFSKKQDVFPTWKSPKSPFSFKTPPETLVFHRTFPGPWTRRERLDRFLFSKRGNLSDHRIFAWKRRRETSNVDTGHNKSQEPNEQYTWFNW